MKLWIRLRKIFHYDWSICGECGRSISKRDWTWFDKIHEKWYCHNCAIKLPLKYSLRELATLNRHEKDQIAAGDHDMVFWIIILSMIFFWLVLAAVKG